LQGKATLAAEDIRFARTIERIQRIIESELTKIALVHLYVQGYKGEGLTNFELKLTTPSIIYEQEKIALLKEKMDLASQMVESKMFSTDYIYENVFNLSEDQYNEQRDLVREDSKRAFRIAQIENEGNDPAKSGVTYGTPHDLASMYGRRGLNGDKVPVGYDESNPEGRPQIHASTHGTQDSPFGRDALGTHDMHGGYDNEEDSTITVSEESIANNVTTKSVYYQNKDLFTPKKSLIFEKKEEKESGLLDESNIKDLGQ